MLKALDLLRNLGWGLIQLIYDLIDSIYNIILNINELDIIGTMAENNIFSNFYNSLIVISITIFGLFITWQFVKKVIEPDDGPTIFQITHEIFKCGILMLLSTMLFAHISMISINLSGYIGNMINNTEMTLGKEILVNYISYSEKYTSNKEFKNDNYKEMLKNGSFGKFEHYNDKFVLEKRFIISDEKGYKYDIEWVLLIIVGGFYLYSTGFSAIILAKRQLEFLFLFLISPIIFATSVCNKQRRQALLEQIVSLTLQSCVVMLIINISVLLCSQINNTTFFENSFQNMTIKSVMYLGSAIFLLTGSQTINRFIGSNVSANSGREQLMSLMGYGKIAKSAGQAITGSGVMAGSGMLAAGNLALQKSGIAAKTGRVANNLLNSMGTKISDFGRSFGSGILADGSPIRPEGNFASRQLQNVGNSITKFGNNMSTKAEARNQNYEGIGLSKKISTFSQSAFLKGLNMTSKNPNVNKIATNLIMRKKRK